MIKIYFNTLSQFINKSIHLFLIMIKSFMKNQNHLYLSKLKKTKYSLEKSLNDLEQYDLDEESIRRSQAASKMSQTTTKSFKGETGYANKKYLNADL